MMTDRTVDTVNVPAVVVTAVCIGCGSSVFICTSVASCNADLSPPYSFIGDKTIWSQTEAISVSLSLRALYGARLRVRLPRLIWSRRAIKVAWHSCAGPQTSLWLPEYSW